ncbi:hypothetical protein BH23BAC1_BH23BAC1_50700 [soil metagenome]
MKSLIFLIIIFGLCACSIRPLGYFFVDPYAKPIGKKVTETFYIVLGEDVKNDFIVSGEGFKKMDISNFRHSVRQSLYNTFNENFENVIFADYPPDKGLALVIYRIRPYWKFCGASDNTTYADGVPYTVNTSYLSAAFQYESSLFLNNEKIRNGDNQVFSEGCTSRINQVHSVFKNGLQVFSESINREIFPDEVLELIPN